MSRTVRRNELEAVRALARLSRLVERSTNGAANRGTTGGGLSLAHYRVLSAVAAGHERASHMARRLALGKPTVSSAVTALCQRGLLTREGVADDQRATALRITPAGTAALSAVEDTLLTRFGPVLARTPDPARVLQSLDWLGTALDELAEHRLAGSVTPR